MRKKLLLPMAALLLAGSGCTQHDLLSSNHQATGDNISFHGYTGKTEKAIPTTDETFNTFRVYAYKGENNDEIVWSSPTTLMKDMEVIKGSNVWEATAPTPWPADGTKVQFFAFSPKAESEKIDYNEPVGTYPTLTMVTSTNIDNQQDLLFAQTAEFAVTKKGENYDPVQLNFKHALSKFRFSAKVQPNQKLLIKEVSIHNLSSTGTLAYAKTPSEGAEETAMWTNVPEKNDSFAIKLNPEIDTQGITNSDEAISITTNDGAPLVIPQKRDKVNVSQPSQNMFTTNNKDSYIKVSYSLQNVTTKEWIVGTQDTRKTAYIPVDIDFSINKAYNFSVNFGTGNGGYDDNGKPIIDQANMIQFTVGFDDWDKETIIPLPEPEPEPVPVPEDSIMSFKIDVNSTVGLNFTLPFGFGYGDGEATGDYTLTIGWGDGKTVKIEKETLITEELLTHTYEAEGTYTVTIKSSEKKCTKDQIPALSFYNSSEHIISLDTPLLRNSKSLEISIQCGNLKTITGELFKYYPDRTSFNSTFYGCSSLTEIPAGLFDKNIDANDFTSLFRRCSSLTKIPAGLFDKNINATQFMSIFKESGLTKIPIGLFDKNINAIDFAYLFQDCKNLEEIPEKLFSKNKKATRFLSTFSGCTKAIVPANLFCDESEQKTRFKGVEGAITFIGAFARVGASLEPKDIQESVLPELWTYAFDEDPRTSQCFAGAKARNSSDENIPAAWREQ
ncbi:MAG: fimbrillin family protein [Phocaeicola sp.]